MNPAQNVLHRSDFGSVGHKRPVDQDDRQAEHAGGVQLGAGTFTPGVFGDDMADVMGLQQIQITRKGKRTTGNNRGCVGQGQCTRCVDKAQKVMMLGLYGELFKVLSPDGEENPRRIIGQSVSGGGHIGHVAPAVKGCGLPRRTLQRQQGQAGNCGGLNRMRAHLGCERMRGVDDVGDAFGAQVCHEAVHATKAANALRQGLLQGVFGTPGIGENARNALIYQGFRQSRGFCGAAKQKDADHG